MRSRIVFALLSVITLFVFVVQPTAAALSTDDANSIFNSRTFYGLDEDQPGCASNVTVANLGGGSSDNGAAAESLELQLSFVWAELTYEFPPNLPVLTGVDNRQKGFNYFISKGLSENESAAIIGNFMQESGMNPKSNQGGGPGRGIAQWSEGDRWDDLLAYVQGLKSGNLAEAKKLLGNESAGLEALKDNKNDVNAATDAFQRAYERAGTPETAKRQEYARAVLDEFGSSGNVPVGTVEAVSGSSAVCSSVGAVNCDNPGNSQLSQVRQNVVCLAEQEYAKWESGELTTGGDFLKYSQGINDEWCAFFVSWIYNQAKYPINESSKEGIEGLVDNVKSIGDDGVRFEYHDKEGYTPVPGDIVYYKESWSHVNIVVSVNVKDKTIGAIGGNQGGVEDNMKTVVSKYETLSWTDGQITGYVSPKD